MKKIAVIGFGHVGKSMARFFQDHFRVFVYDPYVKKIEENLYSQNVLLENNKEIINECDLAVVCIPTPMNDDGSVDLSLINETIKWVDTPFILIKSTVPPGTTQNLVLKTGKKIAFSPEYIGESKYVIQWWKDKTQIHPTDIKFHDFQIFGGERKTTSEILQFFKKILGPGVIYSQTDSTTAEVTKYMENSWGATKVTFFNEFAKIAETFNVDYDELRELFLLDGRTERMHTAVFKDERGFRGKCLPKDVNGIVYASKKAGYNPELLDKVLKVNKKLL